MIKGFVRRIFVMLLLTGMLGFYSSCSADRQYYKMVFEKRPVHSSVSRDDNPYSRKLDRKDTPMRRPYYVPRVNNDKRRAWY